MASRARAWWRAARSAPVLGPALAAADRLWWARTIHRADIVDTDVVALQLGRRVSRRAAIRRYVRGGFRTGFTLNALFMERTVSRQLSDADRVPALYAYLVNDRSQIRVSPAWDARALALDEPTSAMDPAGPLGFAWRRAQRLGWVELGPADAPARVAWDDVVRALGGPLAHACPPALESVLACVLGEQEPDADRALELARKAESLGLTTIVTLTGASFQEQAHAILLSLSSDGIAVRRGEPSTVTRWLEPSARPLTVLRGPGALLRADDLDALVSAAHSGPVAALWLAADGTVASAGFAFRAGIATRLLAGLPTADARRLGHAPMVGALDGPVRAWPAHADPRGPGRTLTAVEVIAHDAAYTAPRSAPDTDAESLLAPTGLRIVPWTAEREAAYARLPGGARRWAIKTAAPAGPAGEAWGDTHFARGLADALERRGEAVSVDAFAARDRQSAALDDVTLVLRGPKRIRPPLTGTRILWVISHPDEITVEELDDFDVVFAASSAWADAASKRFRRTVHPLLQCTDTRRFHPSGHRRGDDIVFVGTARGIARPAVVAPLAAGIPVHVYGPDWTGFIPASAVAATGVPNDALPALYERAGVVLNDHWPAMREHGFVSNRLFDVVAAGGRAISDDVAGITRLFEGAVRVFTSTDDLVQMLSGDLDALFPDPTVLTEIASRVRDRDSFDARAAVLVGALS